MIILSMHIKNENRKGQAILFAVVGITIALAVGVTVASRNLSSISRISRSDTSERAFAAAEGGIEKMLILSGSELNSLMTPTTTSCGLVGGTVVTVDGNAYCRITYPIAPGDPIVSTADLKVEVYNSNDVDAGGNAYLTLDIDNGNMAEVDLRTFSGRITVCWDNANTAIYSNNYVSAVCFQRSLEA
jgi:hypothetical protein